MYLLGTFWWRGARRCSVQRAVHCERRPPNLPVRDTQADALLDCCEPKILGGIGMPNTIVA